MVAWKGFHKAIYPLSLLFALESPYCYDKHVPLIDISGPFTETADILFMLLQRVNRKKEAVSVGSISGVSSAPW